MTILVTGGAGYIGGHTVLALQAAGLPAVILDDLSTGQRHLVPEGTKLIEGDIGDESLLARTIRSHRIDSIIHFAGSIVVSDSVARPLAYYTNNVSKSIRLLEACVANGVRQFVFSSSAAVYGQPTTITVDEQAPTAPMNPYGATKLMFERILADAGEAHGLRYAALRYFNVAGADPFGRTGQAMPGATHLIKVACETALGRRPQMTIFGTDYPTPDGTCIRDYIHVSDLADIHVAAMGRLAQGGDSFVANCGYGRGYSVREVLSAIARVHGAPLNVREAPRREGDPAALVANADRLRQLLGWTPRYDDLDEILRTALAWEQRLSRMRPEAADAA
jgi:UDP-glucose 4-epimerase